MTKEMKYLFSKGQRKYVYEMPISQTVYVPSTSAKSRPVSKKTMQNRVGTVRRYLASKFGGYTSVSSVGGYVSDKGKLIKEPVVAVHAHASYADERKYKKPLVKQVGCWGKKWGQETMGFELNNDFFLIRPNVAGKKGCAREMPRRPMKRKARRTRVKRQTVYTRPNPRRQNTMPTLASLSQMRGINI